PIHDALPISAIHGYGAQFLVGNGASPEVFEAVAGVLSVTPGELSTADIDTTHLRSPNRHREHRSGIRDSGPWSLTGTYLPDEESQSNTGGGSGAFQGGGLMAMAADGVNRNFKVIFNDGSPATELIFRGYVASFQLGEIGVDDKVNFTASIQPTEAYDANLP